MRRKLISHVLSLLLVAAIGGGLKTPARAVEPAPPTVTQTLPGLPEMPGPSWVKPGLRLSYEAIFATIRGPGRMFEVFEDLDRNLWALEHDPSGPSGRAISQMDVVALDGATVAIATRSYVMRDAVAGPPVFSGEIGQTTAASTGGDLWIHPSALAQLVAAHQHEPIPNPTNPRHGEVVVFAMDYPLGQRTYHTAQVHYTTARSSYRASYDLESGVLLRLVQGTERPAGLREGDTTAEWHPEEITLNFSTLLGTRQLSLPWADAPPPAWVSSAQRFVYQGQRTTGSPYMTPVSLRHSNDVQTIGRGAGWLAVRSVFTLEGAAGMPPISEQRLRVFGAAQIGSLWVTPTALANLQTGETIDRDPYTGVVVQITQGCTRNANGVTIAVISEVGAVDRLDHGYDCATGLYRWGRYTDQFPQIGLTNTSEFELVGAQ